MRKWFRIISVIALYFLAVGCNNKKDENNTSNSSANIDTTSVKTKTIIFFGNSLTAGYGLNPSQPFPALIQKKRLIL